MVEFNPECEQQSIHEGSLYLHAQTCLMLIRQNTGRGCNSFGTIFLILHFTTAAGAPSQSLAKYFPLMKSFLR